jgi:hypothetical protein
MLPGTAQLFARPIGCVMQQAVPSGVPFSNTRYVVGSKRFQPDQLFKVTEIKQRCYLSILLFIFSGSAAQRAGYDLLVTRGFVITHNDMSQSVGLLWASDQLVAETST